MRWKKPDKTVVQMWIGEVVFLVLCEVVGMFLVKQRISYTVGLVSGGVLAMLATYHIWWVLDCALDLEEKAAQKMIGTKYLLRYALLLLLLAVLYVTKLGNPFAAFLGYMSLKAGAYFQPFLDKKMREREVN